MLTMDTLNPPSSPPAPGSGERDSTQPAKFTVPAVVLQFFVFPLAVVVVCCLLFLFVGWLTHEARGPAELLDAVTDPRSGSESRWQAAQALARILDEQIQEARRARPASSDPVALPPEVAALGPRVLEAFRRLSRDDSQDRVRIYIIKTLGLLRHRPAVPDLAEALPKAAAEVKIALIEALGSIGDPAALPALMAELANAPDAGVRLQAAFSLGSLRDRRAIAPLQARLQDPVPDVRWNAALALSRFLDDPEAQRSAKPVLLQMLDAAHVRSVVEGAMRRRDLNWWNGMWEGASVGRDDLVAEVMRNAMTAAVLLQDHAFEPPLEAIGRETGEIPRVRDYAMKTLERLRSLPARAN